MSELQKLAGGYSGLMYSFSIILSGCEWACSVLPSPNFRTTRQSSPANAPVIIDTHRHTAGTYRFCAAPNSSGQKPSLVCQSLQPMPRYTSADLRSVPSRRRANMLRMRSLNVAMMLPR